MKVDPILEVTIRENVRRDRRALAIRIKNDSALTAALDEVMVRREAVEARQCGSCVWQKSLEKRTTPKAKIDLGASRRRQPLA